MTKLCECGCGHFVGPSRTKPRKFFSRRCGNRAAQRAWLKRKARAARAVTTPVLFRQDVLSLKERLVVQRSPLGATYQVPPFPEGLM